MVVKNLKNIFYFLALFGDVENGQTFCLAKMFDKQYLSDWPGPLLGNSTNGLFRTIGSGR